MEKIEFGAEIVVDGMPDWVGDDTQVMAQWRNDVWYTGGHAPKSCYSSPEAITRIRLPIDHPHYRTNTIPGVEMVSLPVMTEDEARDWVEGALIAWEDGEALLSHVLLRKFRELGLVEPEAIPEPTDLERFTAATGIAFDEDIHWSVGEVIKWARENG